MERHSGFIQFSGDGSTKTFLIPHGCSFEPYFVSTEPATIDALGISLDGAGVPLLTNCRNYVTTTDPIAFGPKISVRFQVAPPIGTNNIQFFWSAECN